MSLFYLLVYWLCFVDTAFFIVSIHSNIQFSGAAAAKNSLIAKGHHVDYENIKAVTSNGGGSGGNGGQMNRYEIRSTHTANGGDSENRDCYHVINDTESFYNR